VNYDTFTFVQYETDVSSVLVPLSYYLDGDDDGNVMGRTIYLLAFATAGTA
jgi:hypothetical protein